MQTNDFRSLCSIAMDVKQVSIQPKYLLKSGNLSPEKKSNVNKNLASIRKRLISFLPWDIPS